MTKITVITKELRAKYDKQIEPVVSDSQEVPIPHDPTILYDMEEAHLIEFPSPFHSSRRKKKQWTE